MAKQKKLLLTNKDINELLNIIDVLKGHLQDYDLEDGPYDESMDSGCIYFETNEDCNKWEEILEKLKKQRYSA